METKENQSGEDSIMAITSENYSGDYGLEYVRKQARQMSKAMRSPKPNALSELRACPKCLLVLPKYRYIEHVKECEGDRPDQDDD